MIPPHRATLIALAALPAVLYYVYAIPDAVVSIAAINVVLITISLYIAFGGISDDPHDNTGHVTE